MRTDVICTEAERKALSKEGIAALERVVAAFTKDVYAQASQFEDGSRPDNGRREITAQHVEDAMRAVRRGQHRRRRSKGYAAAVIVQSVIVGIGSIVTSFWATDPMAPAAAVAALVVSVAITGFTLSRE